MATVEELLVRIDATTEGLRRELRQMDQAVAGTSTRTERSLARIDRAFAGLGRTMLQTGAAFAAGFGAERIISDAARAITQTQALQTRLTRLTGSAEAAAEAQEYLSATAQRLSVDYFALADSYTRLLPLVESNVVSTSDARDILEGFANVAAATGATTGQLEQSMYGLAQGLSAGVLRAEELNQVTEPLPGLLQALDRASGQAAGGFRRMVVDGQVTSDMFRQTLIVALREYEGAAEETSGNVAQSFVRLQNEYSQLLATLALEPSNNLASFLDEITALLERLNDLTGEGSGWSKLTGAVFNPSLWNLLPGVGLYRTLEQLGVFRDTGDLDSLRAEEGRLREALAASPNNPGIHTELAQVQALIAELESGINPNRSRNPLAMGPMPVPIMIPPAGDGGGSGGGGAGTPSGRTFADVLEDLNTEKARQDAEELVDIFREGEQVFLSTRTEAELYAMEVARLDELLAAGAITQDTYNRALEDAEIAARDTNGAARELGLTFTSAFEDAIVQGEGLRDVLAGIAQDLARLTIRRGVTEPFLDWFGGLDFGSIFGGFFAEGGRPPTGKVSVVGERGPELFVPDTAGTIVPNHALGGMTFAPVYQIDARNSTLSAGEIRAIVDASSRKAVDDVRNLMNRTGSARI